MAALGCCIGMSVLLGACGAKLDVQENTIALQKSGKVLEAAVESFDQSYYDEEELNTYVQKAVEAYNAGAWKEICFCDRFKSGREKSISYPAI